MTYRDLHQRLADRFPEPVGFGEVRTAINALSGSIYSGARNLRDLVALGALKSDKTGTRWTVAAYPLPERGK